MFNAHQYVGLLYDTQPGHCPWSQLDTLQWSLVLYINYNEYTLKWLLGQPGTRSRLRPAAAAHICFQGHPKSSFFFCTLPPTYWESKCVALHPLWRSDGIRRLQITPVTPTQFENQTNTCTWSKSPYYIFISYQGMLCLTKVAVPTNHHIPGPYLKEYIWNHEICVSKHIFIQCGLIKTRIV